MLWNHAKNVDLKNVFSKTKPNLLKNLIPYLITFSLKRKLLPLFSTTPMSNFTFFSTFVYNLSNCHQVISSLTSCCCNSGEWEKQIP